MTGRDTHDPEDELLFTVASVWREERISCPHPDVLRAYEMDSLPEGAAAFVKFHLEESRCPYCNATLEDLRAADEDRDDERLEDLRDRLMRSTIAALRRTRATD